MKKLFFLSLLLSAYFCHTQQVATVTSANAIAQRLLKKSPLSISLGSYGIVEVIAAKFSPDGSKIITICADGTAKIWNVKTWRLLLTLADNNSPVNAGTLNFSPDGSKVVITSLRKTNMWDVSTGQLLYTFVNDNFGLNSAAFSPDGKYMVAACDDYTVKIWNAATWQHLYTLNNSTGTVFSAASSPNGKFIVTACDDNSAKIWDVETRQILRILAGHNNLIPSAEFSPDDTKVVTASWDDTAGIWDVTSGELLHHLTGHTAWVHSAAFSPDGKYIVTASSDRTAKIWNALTGRLVDTLPDHTDGVFSVAFSPDSTKIVTTSLDKTAKIWNISNIIIAHYFSNKTLPLAQQTTLVTLDDISLKNYGGPIKKKDLDGARIFFSKMPENVVAALKDLYKLDDDIFNRSPLIMRNNALRNRKFIVTRADILKKQQAKDK